MSQAKEERSHCKVPMRGNPHQKPTQTMKVTKGVPYPPQQVVRLTTPLKTMIKITEVVPNIMKVRVYGNYYTRVCLIISSCKNQLVVPGRHITVFFNCQVDSV